MEVVNFLRQDLESRKSAYNNSYIDDDWKRILEQVDPSLKSAVIHEDVDQTDHHDSSRYERYFTPRKVSTGTVLNIRLI